MQSFLIEGLNEFQNLSGLALMPPFRGQGPKIYNFSTQPTSWPLEFISCYVCLHVCLTE